MKFNCYAQWDGAKYKYVIDNQTTPEQTYNTNFFVRVIDADNDKTLYPTPYPTNDSLPVYYKDDVTSTFIYWFMFGFILNMVAIVGAVAGGLSIILKN